MKPNIVFQTQRFVAYIPEPLVIPVTDDLRRYINKNWYWEHRELFLEKYSNRFLLIDNGKILCDFADLIQAYSEWKDNFYAYLVLVGEEDFAKFYYSKEVLNTVLDVQKKRRAEETTDSN